MLVLSTVLFVGALMVFADNQISAKALSSHGCDDSEWHFIITQIDDPSLAPASIHVEWANGASANLTLSSVTGKSAHYYSYENLDSTVISATTSIYDGWEGEFNLSHGPCGEPTPDPTEEVTDTPTPDPTEEVTDTPTPDPTEEVTDTPTPDPTEEVTDTPTPDPTEEVTDTPTPDPTEEVTDTPTPDPTEEVTDTPTPDPTEEVTDTPTPDPTEEVTDTPTPDPTEEVTDTPTPDPTEEVTDTPTPTEPPTETPEVTPDPTDPHVPWEGDGFMCNFWISGEQLSQNSILPPTQFSFTTSDGLSVGGENGWGNWSELRPDGSAEGSVMMHQGFSWGNPSWLLIDNTTLVVQVRRTEDGANVCWIPNEEAQQADPVRFEQGAPVPAQDVTGDWENAVVVDTIYVPELNFQHDIYAGVVVDGVLHQPQGQMTRTGNTYDYHYDFYRGLTTLENGDTVILSGVEYVITQTLILDKDVATEYLAETNAIAMVSCWHDIDENGTVIPYDDNLVQVLSPVPQV